MLAAQKVVSPNSASKNSFVAARLMSVCKQLSDLHLSHTRIITTISLSPIRPRQNLYCILSGGHINTVHSFINQMKISCQCNNDERVLLVVFLFRFRHEIRSRFPAFDLLCSKKPPQHEQSSGDGMNERFIYTYIYVVIGDDDKADAS